MLSAPRPPALFPLALFSFAPFLLALSAAAPAEAAQPIAGRWLTEDGRAVVTVGPCGNTLCGRVSAILHPAPNGVTTDRNNPDPAARNRPLRGLEVLSGFRDAGGDWRGRIYDPVSGRTYKSIVRREGATLNVQGCVLFICRTQRWAAAR